MDPRTVIVAMALSIVLAVLLVGGRFLLGLFFALRAHRYKIATVSIAGLICIVASFAAILVVWFGYAVAHTGKDVNTDLRIFSITIPPYFLVAFGLWLLGGKLLSLIRKNKSD